MQILLLIKCAEQLMPSCSSSGNDLLASVRGALEMKNLRLLVLFVSFFLVDSCSSSSSCFIFSKRGNVFLQEGKSLCSKKSRAIPPPSLVTVWGIQSKVCPVTCSPRNKQPAQSPKTKAIRGGRPVCELNRGTFLKASITEKIVSCRSGE